MGGAASARPRLPLCSNRCCFCPSVLLMLVRREGGQKDHLAVCAPARHPLCCDLADISVWGDDRRCGLLLLLLRGEDHVEEGVKSPRKPVDALLQPSSAKCCFTPPFFSSLLHPTLLLPPAAAPWLRRRAFADIPEGCTGDAHLVPSETVRAGARTLHGISNLVSVSLLKPLEALMTPLICRRSLIWRDFTPQKKIHFWSNLD